MMRPRELDIEARKSEAVDWLVRRRSASTDVSAAFEAWLEQAPDNADAYAEVERAWSAVALAGDDPELIDLRQSVSARAAQPRRAIAAGLVAALLGLSALGAYQLAAPKALADQSFRTGVGQQATVTLPDGTSVTLNTDTVVRTRADEGRRLVYLERGQAYFKVAKDRRHPFVVTAAGRTVTALGTAFDVRVDGRELKVVLVEGRVRVESIKPAGLANQTAPQQGVLATEMGPGSQLVAPDDADWRVTRTDTARETSWLHGQIVIDDKPLREVVEELNRYSERKVVLVDARLGDAHLSGIFRPGDLEGLASALETSKLGRVADSNQSELRIVAMK
jgi:transmembrane sensor